MATGQPLQLNGYRLIMITLDRYQNWQNNFRDQVPQLGGTGLLVVFNFEQFSYLYFSLSLNHYISCSVEEASSFLFQFLTYIFHTALMVQSQIGSFVISCVVCAIPASISNTTCSVNKLLFLDVCCSAFFYSFVLCLFLLILQSFLIVLPTVKLLLKPIHPFT